MLAVIQCQIAWRQKTANVRPLTALDAIEDRPTLERYPMLPVVQAELWREAGEPGRAAECDQAALARARSELERRWWASRL